MGMKKAINIKKTRTSLEPNQGERAFIYQQASELPAPAMVLMDGEGGSCNVTFVIDPLNSGLKFTGRGANIVEAAMEAKSLAQKALAQMALPLEGLDFEDEDRDFSPYQASQKHSSSIH